MESKTKTGLLLLMIYVLISLVSGIVAYSLFYSVDLTTGETTGASILASLVSVIPILILAFVGGLIGFIGAIFMLLGRKEFGEKHQKFIFYALLVFVVAIVVMIITTIVVAFFTYSYVSNLIPGDSINDTNFMSSTVLIIIVIIGLISVILSNLIWVFGLYQLENNTGRICLVLYYILSIAVSLILYVYIALSGSVPSTGIGSSSYSQWVGMTGFISLLASILPNIFLFVSIYIPYQRISSGELVPIPPMESSAAPSRMCPNCGRSIPFDATTCPYCGKRFEDFL